MSRALVLTLQAVLLWVGTLTVAETTFVGWLRLGALGIFGLAVLAACEPTRQERAKQVPERGQVVRPGDTRPPRPRVAPPLPPTSAGRDANEARRTTRQEDDRG